MVDFKKRLKRNQIDPRKLRLSQNFTLSDFLGNHSVYSRGLANPFVLDEFAEGKLANIRALCEHGLEPILKQFGTMSVGYGYISPEVSRQIVTYMDPDKPSHHRADLGAAADICVHRWVAGEFKTLQDLYLPDTALGAPISLAHGIDYLGVPYSRMITYSESPYICLAVSANEVAAKLPRKAFYENRYMGREKVKPDYRQYATPAAKNRAFKLLQEHGLQHPWQGAGYPTYHGGGFQQYQHMRVSKYTMVSDWLFDLNSIANGARNIPSLDDDRVQDAFAAAGIVYDWIIDQNKSTPHRHSIVSGYVSHLNPNCRDDGCDWRQEYISFRLNPCILPAAGNAGAGGMAVRLNLFAPVGVDFTYDDDGFVVANIHVETVLNSEEFQTS